MSTTVTMPQLGESVVEGTIGKWLVKEGDRVERDQPVVEVLTDKADSEVPSPVAGVISKLLAKEDEVVRVGAGLCVVDEAGAAAQAAPAKSAPSASKRANEILPPAPERQPEPQPVEAKASEPKPAAPKPAEPRPAAAPSAGRNGPAAIATAAASPSARKHAREQGLELTSSALAPSRQRDRAGAHSAHAGPLGARPSQQEERVPGPALYGAAR